MLNTQRAGNWLSLHSVNFKQRWGKVGILHHVLSRFYYVLSEINEINSFISFMWQLRMIHMMAKMEMWKDAMFDDALSKGYVEELPFHPTCTNNSTLPILNPKLHTIIIMNIFHSYNFCSCLKPDSSYRKSINWINQASKLKLQWE